jgi:hypothetical protein
MVRNDIQALIAEQKQTKPTFEDVAASFLKGDVLRNALDFAEWLRENGMNPRWSSAQSWRVTGKKSKPICKINLGGAKHAWVGHLEAGDWQICELESMGRDYMDEFISCNEMKELIWKNVKSCNKCSVCGPRCWTYFGKQFDDCCALLIKNPDARELELAKKLVEVNKQHIYDNA